MLVFLDSAATNMQSASHSCFIIQSCGSGTCFYNGDFLPVAGNPFLCCGESVDDLDVCNSACQLKAENCGTGVGKGVAQIECKAYVSFCFFVHIGDKLS